MVLPDESVLSPGLAFSRHHTPRRRTPLSRLSRLLQLRAEARGCRRHPRHFAAALKRAGFGVWIVPPGSEPVAEVWSRGVGIDRAHTVAIRSVFDDKGRITTSNKGLRRRGCHRGRGHPVHRRQALLNQPGDLRDRGPAAWTGRASHRRITLGGGDADTDVTFVGDAKGAHLVLNSDRIEVMRRANGNADGRWGVNPMFIDPLLRRTTARPCFVSFPQAVLKADDSSVLDRVVCCGGKQWEQSSDESHRSSAIGPGQGALFAVPVGGERPGGGKAASPLLGGLVERGAFERSGRPRWRSPAARSPSASREDRMSVQPDRTPATVHTLAPGAPAEPRTAARRPAGAGLPHRVVHAVIHSCRVSGRRPGRDSAVAGPASARWPPRS